MDWEETKLRRRGRNVAFTGFQYGESDLSIGSTGIADTIRGKMRLKHQLNYYLKKTGLNASQLSRKAGVPKQSLSDWLAGASPRKLEHLKKVADILQISIDHLCFGEGSEVPASDALSFTLKDPKSEHWTEGIFEVKFRKLRD